MKPLQVAGTNCGSLLSGLGEGKRECGRNTKQPKLFSALVVVQMKKLSTAEDLHGYKKAKQKTLKNP